MLERLWSRIKAFVAGLFRRKPPPPGRFESDKKAAFRGLLTTAPWVWPSREFLIYVPQGHTNWRKRALLVLIHGCHQTPEDFAAGTRVTALADSLGCLVLLPRQDRRANSWGCWNWFDQATAHGWGETAIVAAQVHAVHSRFRIDSRRVFVAGMSSGGALASALGVRRPDLVAGVFVHSGIGCGAASSPLSATQVLRTGADQDIMQIARDIREKTAIDALPVPLVAIQGSNDTVVPPIHAAQLVRQYLVLNGHPNADAEPNDAIPPPDRTMSTVLPDDRVVTTSEWRIGDRMAARHVLVDGLGHAWSGGDANYPYNDSHAPDATALLQAFMAEALR